MSWNWFVVGIYLTHAEVGQFKGATLTPFILWWAKHSATFPLDFAFSIKALRYLIASELRVAGSPMAC